MDLVGLKHSKKLIFNLTSFGQSIILTAKFGVVLFLCKCEIGQQSDVACDGWAVKTEQIRKHKGKGKS